MSYLIFDRYADQSTLKRVYDYDNSEFLQYLTDKGFYVASESRANYEYTVLSLLSSLNMEHLQSYELPGDMWGQLLYDQEYKVWRFLKRYGYKYYHLGPWWGITATNKHADVNIVYSPLPVSRYISREFVWVLYRTTPINPVFKRLGGHPAGGFSFFNFVQYQRVLYKFDELSKIPDIKEPKFVFCHMLLPHPPYVFDRDGNFRNPESLDEKSYKAYIDQLIFTNEKIKALIDQLISKSQTPPIIIIQSDEGPYPSLYTDWDGATATVQEMRQKMRILNAYYLPGVDYSDVLYPSITPVNTFRLIFNVYFNAGFALLPDESYLSINFNVTDKVRFDEEERHASQ